MNDRAKSHAHVDRKRDARLRSGSSACAEVEAAREEGGRGVPARRGCAMREGAR